MGVFSRRRPTVLARNLYLPGRRCVAAWRARRFFVICMILLIIKKERQLRLAQLLGKDVGWRQYVLHIGSKC